MTIKPLEWEEVDRQKCSTTRRYVAGEFDGLTYSIRALENGGKFCASLDMPDHECYMCEVRVIGTYDTLAEAQEASQVLHERRISKWLETPPSAMSGGTLGPV
jgi:hypothetical protein